MGAILLIDDDAALLDVLTLAFEDAGHRVLSATDGASGLATAQRDKPSLVVSDVNMPLLDGFTLCRRLRAAGDDVPLILLTARDSDIDQALGLELGADDYVIKPFSTRVLLLRAQALLRRQEVRGRGGDRAPVVVGALTLSGDRLEARYQGEPISVTVTEFKMLEALTARPGGVMSRERLLDLVRGDDSVVAARLIDTYVRRLRRKLEAVDASFDCIETVIGAGYRWRAP